MYKIYLTEKDMASPNHFPVIALINEACNYDVEEFICSLKNGVGIGYNYSNCSFWSDLDEQEKESIPEFKGLLVETEDEEQATVDIQEVFCYLKSISDKNDNSEIAKLIKELL